MPKFEAKEIHSELEKGRLRPVYWLYGPERVKSRELLKRIRNAVRPKTEATSSELSTETESSAGPSLFSLGWGEEVFDGSEVSVYDVINSALSPSLGGGTKLIIVKDAHLIKEVEAIQPLLETDTPGQELYSVCVFISKDLDARKKSSKLILDRAAVIPCDEITENQRESWVLYLAKQKQISLSPDILFKLCILDPWSLGVIEQELEKIKIASESDQSQILSEGVAGKRGDEFLEEFLSRNSSLCLARLQEWTSDPSEVLPFLGLLTWNLRQLLFYLLSNREDTKGSKINPYLLERLKKWKGRWSVPELLELQTDLTEVDFKMKQTRHLPLGLWTELVLKWAKA